MLQTKECLLTQEKISDKIKYLIDYCRFALTRFEKESLTYNRLDFILNELISFQNQYLKLMAESSFYISSTKYLIGKLNDSISVISESNLNMIQELNRKE